MAAFKLAVVTCLWKRQEIAGIFLDSLLEQFSRMDISSRIFCVGSGGEEERWRFDRPAVGYSHHPNRPLGKKFNFCLSRAREWGPDAVLVIGSDDLVTSSVVGDLVEAIRRDVDVAGCLDAYFLEARSGNAIHWPGYEGKEEPIGSARMYSKRILEALDWALWGDSLNSSLDGSATRRCNEHQAVWFGLRMDAPERVFLGIKGEPMLNSWEALKQTSREVPAEEFLEKSFGPEIAQRIRALREAHA